MEHIVNRLLVYNSSDNTVYLSDLNLYIQPNVILDLHQYFDEGTISQSTSLQLVLGRGWLQIVTAQNYDTLVNHEGVRSAGLFRSLSFDVQVASYGPTTIDSTLSADMIVDPLYKFQKLFGSDDIYAFAINDDTGNIIAVNYEDPTTLTLNVGDVFVGGKNSGVWVAQEPNDWYAVEPMNLIASAPEMFEDIIRGQTIVLPTVANNTISRIDLYLTEFDVYSASEIEYSLIIELYYADSNNRPIGTIGVDYLAQDIIEYDDDRLNNKDDFYSFDFGESGFQGTSNRYAVIYRVETEDNKEGFIWWDTSTVKQEEEKIESYVDGVSIISKDGGTTWETRADYDRTLKVYYPKPNSYEVSDVTFDEVFSLTADTPSVALVILVDESGSILTSNNN